MGQATQRQRQLAISTPLGDDKLLLTGFAGREELSRLFSYQLDLLSEDHAIRTASLVGKPVTFTVRREDGTLRFFNGFVKQASAGPLSRMKRYRRYRAEVVPWLWFLTQTADCRIFQQKSVPEIIAQIFGDLGFDAFNRSRLRGSYAKRVYCVQYRETDFQFVSRLMEEEGIFYFFRHKDGEHELVLGDAPTAYPTSAQATLRYQRHDGLHRTDERLTEWEHYYQFRTGKWAHTDYNFEIPKTSLMADQPTVVALPRAKDFEVYDYPGEYGSVEEGRRLVQIRIEEEEAGYDVASGESTCRALTPGEKFTLADYEVDADNGQAYVVTSIEHQAEEPAEYETVAAGDEGPQWHYGNRFQCIPASVAFRPARTTRRPVVEGPQTAVIVGPPGEEIYPDQYGRVKVQFHWDREGKRDDASSCWIRVSQVHAGRNWGAMDLPRIGEEVIVDFLEGDPDQPIITGRVYNAENMPPFNLPAEKTRRGNKTKTYTGSGYNELSMDDTPGKEQIRVNAQYNMDTAVGNNQTLLVGIDRSAKIGNNDALKVGNNSTEDVGNNKAVTVGNNMNVQVGKNLVINAGSSITLKCGASRIYMNSGGVILITGTIITTAAAANAAVVAPLTQVIGGILLTTVGGINMLQGGVTHVGAAALCSISGGKTDVVASGETAIKGAPIKLN